MTKPLTRAGIDKRLCDHLINDLNHAMGVMRDAHLVTHNLTTLCDHI